MGKKRGKKGAGGGDDDWEGGSVASESTTASFLGADASPEVERADEWGEALDWTYESRGSTRERGWERLAGLLRNSVREECWQHAATVIGRCQAALKKGGATEATLAATALALHVLTLGEPDESGYQGVLPDLLRAAKHGKSAAARAAAVDALAVCCFVMAEDDRSTRAALDELRGVWAKRDAGAPLRAAALRGWTFLFTSLAALPDAAAVEALLPAAAALLHDGDVELRAAAGEAIAVVYHTCGLDQLEAVLEGEEEEEGEDEEEGEGEGGGGEGGEGGGEAVSGLSEVVGRMRDLATNRGDRQRRSRRDRAALRGAFRDITRIIE
ncbi:hypothetical protein Rsub_06359, partial [Raphidocelis subcapitata]